jgi:hypothetical protein
LLQLKLLSLRRAAQSLGLSPITLKNAVANGDVPATQLNGRLRFEQSVLATWAFGTHRRAAKPERWAAGSHDQPLKAQSNVLSPRDRCSGSASTTYVKHAYGQDETYYRKAATQN